MDPPPDLECLSEEERNLILSVLQRDEELRSGLQNRACQVKQEVHELRMKSVLRNGDDLSKICARCKTPFGFLFNTGDICPVCRFRVCKDCREKTLNSQGWMCSLCFKENQLKWLSNENLADDSDDDNGEGGGKERDAADSDTYPHSTPPLTSRDPCSPTPLYAGGGHHTQRPQIVRKPNRFHATSRRPADSLQKNQSPTTDSRRKSDPGDIDSGFSTIISPEDDSSAGLHSNCYVQKEAAWNGGTVGSQRESDQKCVVGTSVRGGKDPCQTSAAKSQTAHETKTGEFPDSVEENRTKKKKAFVSHAKKTSNTIRQNSGCSFTSSEPPCEISDEVFPRTDSTSASHGKKEKMDSTFDQYTKDVSTNFAEIQLSKRIGTPDSPFSSKSAIAAQPSLESTKGNKPDSNSKAGDHKQQTFSISSGILNASTAPRSPVQRQSSVFSEMLSASSTKTASPTTKIRLLDLASNRALERDGSDSQQSWSAGSEDTLSLGLSCSGFAVTAQPNASHKAHEAERQRAISTSEQSEQSEQSDREKPAATDGLSEEAAALLSAQRSNSMGDLLGNGAPTVSQMHYKKRALAGSMDQLNHDTEDDIDGAVSRYRKRGKPLSRSRFSLAASRESLVSVYSSAGEVNYGRIPVSGEITFGLHYDQRQSALKIHLKGCHDLAPVDTKHNRSDPYVKTYLLPDKTRSGKRKSKIKKRTLNPDYNETLSYTISPGELETRTLWVTVWHSDRFGRNDFLGEVNLPMDMELFDDTSPQTYPLQSRTADDLSETALQYKGEVILSLMYLTPDNAQAAREEAPKKSKSRFKKSKKTSATSPPMGEVHVLIKSAKHLMAVRSNGSSDAFVKGYLLPDRSRAGKQKTPVVKNSLNPMWNHILVFEGVDSAELADRSLELTVWDHEKLGTNEFLGGTRLNLGSGTTKGGQQVDWMDSRGEESTVWRNMMDQPNTWVDATLHLRPSMSKGSAKH